MSTTQEPRNLAYDALAAGTGHVLVALGNLSQTIPLWPCNGNSGGNGAGANAIIQALCAIEQYYRTLNEVLKYERLVPPPPPSPE